MRHLRWMSVFAILVAGAAVAAPPYTVGDLTVRLAGLLDLESDTAEDARLALAVEGIEIRTGLSSVLLEGDAIDLLNQLGLQLTTRTPGEPIGSATVDAIFASLLGEDTILPAGMEGMIRPEGHIPDGKMRRIRAWCRDHPTAPHCVGLASRFGVDP